MNSKTLSTAVQMRLVESQYQDEFYRGSQFPWHRWHPGYYSNHGSYPTVCSDGRPLEQKFQDIQDSPRIGRGFRSLLNGRGPRRAELIFGYLIESGLSSSWETINCNNISQGSKAVAIVMVEADSHGDLLACTFVVLNNKSIPECKGIFKAS